MQVKNIPFEEVFDILALRIIFDVEDEKDEKTTCWGIYSAVTDIYKPHPDRIVTQLHGTVDKQALVFRCLMGGKEIHYKGKVSKR